MPTVSVIIPTRDRIATLPRAVSSVTQQSYQDWDLHIVDDGSTDGSESWYQDWRSQHRGPQAIYWHKRDGKGVSAARNFGIQVSSGKWLAFLDSDDEWFPQKLEKQMAVAHDSEAVLIHCNEAWVRRGLPLMPLKKHRKSGGRIFLRCVEICCISPSAALIARSLLDEIGAFREDFPVCEDYELWLRVTAQYPVHYVDEILLTKFGGHSDQLSHQYKAMDYWRVRALLTLLNHPDLQEIEKKEVARSILHRTSLLIRGYLRHNNMSHWQEMTAAQEIAKQWLPAESEPHP